MSQFDQWNVRGSYIAFFSFDRMATPDASLNPGMHLSSAVMPVSSVAARPLRYANIHLRVGPPYFHSPLVHEYSAMPQAARKRALPPWLLTTATLVLGISAAQEFTGHARQASPSLQTPASGSCQLVDWPAAAETRYAAMNYLQWGGSHYCGQCIEVWCADSSKEIVHIVDWCRDCQHGDLRLSSNVFQALAEEEASETYEVQWRFVRCPETADLGFQVCLQTERSAYSLAIQPMNPAEPIHSIAVNGVEAAREFPGLFYSIKDTRDFDLKRVRLTISTQSGVVIESTISLESGECVRVARADPTKPRSPAQSDATRRPQRRRGDGTAAVERSRNLGESSSSDSTTTITTSTHSSGSSATAGSTEGKNVSCSDVVSSSGSNSRVDGFVLCRTTTNDSVSTANETTSASTSASASTSTTSSRSGPTSVPTTGTSGSGSTAAVTSSKPQITASGSASASLTESESPASTATATSESTSAASTSTTETTTETTATTTTITATGSAASQIAVIPYQTPQTQSSTPPTSDTSGGFTNPQGSTTSSTLDSASALPTTDTEESFSLLPIVATSQAPPIASSSSPSPASSSNSNAQQAPSSSSSHTLSASGSSSIDQFGSESGSLSSSMDEMDDSLSQSQAHQWSADGSTKSSGTAVGSASNATDPNKSAQTSMGDIFTSPFFFAALLLGIVGCAGSCAAYRAKKKSLLSATPRHPVVFTPTDIESSMEVHASDPPFGTRTSRSSSSVRAMSNDLLAADVMIFPSATL